MRCLICDSNDWENVDDYRFKKEDMSICKSCSFVSYPTKWKSEEEIKQYYRKDYRSMPSVGNLYSGQRKVHFHQFFLDDLLKQWKKEGRIEPEICEIGAAYGMALAWFKQAYPGCKVSGTELTISYRRNAYHEFGIELTEDFDDTKKYDLIMSYKVAEHQIDVDKMLTKYRSCLKENGLMYISVPCWFGQMNNFGLGGFDLEYYYSTNHINVWTKKLFESLLKKVGLEIVKEDHIIYDSTYLVKVCEPKELTKDDFEDIRDIKDRMYRIKKAFILSTENKFKDAIDVYPDFPQAHISNLEITRKESFENGWDWIKENIINKMFEDCVNTAEIFLSAADLAMRYKKFEEAIIYLENGLKTKPGNPAFLSKLIDTMREIALHSDTDKKKQHYFEQARQISRYLREVSLESTPQATNNIYIFNSQLPIPSEIMHDKQKGP
ncbi:MAG: class I SAM-dependent methyltransferase [Bdellovibrionales bacterium]|nr:class I SAM-dependent methyltransferase [Bdellovibrionales bacterium]